MCVLGWLLPVSAQIFGSKTDTSGMVWKIRFSLDAGLKPLSITKRDFYSGEFYNSGTQSWSWKTWDSTSKKLQNTIPAQGQGRLSVLGSGNLSVMLNVVKDLYVGFSYTPFWFSQNYTYQAGVPPITYTSTNTAFLFGLSGSVGYDIKMPFYKRLSLQPSVSYGGYAGNDSYEYWEGTGNESFMEGRLGIAFRPFKYNQIRAWASWQHYRYHENFASAVFPDKNRVVTTTATGVYVGLGYVFNLHIPEDMREKKSKAK